MINVTVTAKFLAHAKYTVLYLILSLMYVKKIHQFLSSLTVYIPAVLALVPSPVPSITVIVTGDCRASIPVVLCQVTAPYSRILLGGGFREGRNDGRGPSRLRPPWATYRRRHGTPSCYIASAKF